MSKLIKMLEYYTEDSAAQRQKIIEDTKDKELKQLLLSTESTPDILIKEEVVNTIQEAMRASLVMRDALPVMKTEGKYVKYPVSDKGVVYAADVPEGKEIPTTDEKLREVEFTVKKIGVRPLITHEMVADQKERDFNLVERLLKQAGEQLENKLNRDALETLLKDADATHDVQIEKDGNILDYIAKAVYNVKKRKFLPDTLVISPIAEAKLLTDSRMLLSIIPDKQLIQEGMNYPKILGLKMLSTNIDAEYGTFNWGGNEPQDPIALIYDYDQAGMIIIREELRVERYDDPIRDLEGMAVTMRYATGVIHPDAICKLEHE